MFSSCLFAGTSPAADGYHRAHGRNVGLSKHELYRSGNDFCDGRTLKKPSGFLRDSLRRIPIAGSNVGGYVLGGQVATAHRRFHRRGPPGVGPVTGKVQPGQGCSLREASLLGSGNCAESGLKHFYDGEFGYRSCLCVREYPRHFRRKYLVELLLGTVFPLPCSTQGDDDMLTAAIVSRLQVGVVENPLQRAIEELERMTGVEAS